MYFQTAIPTPSQEQPCCLVIIRPPSGVCTSAYHPVPTGCLPAGLMQHIGDSFSSKIGRAQRMYCRGFLLQTSVISVVDLAKIENNPIGTNYDVIVHENGPDKTLTKALHNPELLANVPFEVFMANQPGLFI